jgi:hypothetical protein
MATTEAVRALERRNERIDAHIRALLSTVGTTEATVTAPRVVNVAFVLGAVGTPLVVGDHVFLQLGLGGTVTLLSWSMAGTVAGTPTASDVVIDVLAGATLATVVSMTGAATPELTADIELNDQPVSAWTFALLTDPSWVMALVTDADGTVEVVGLTLRVVVG